MKPPRLPRALMNAMPPAVADALRIIGGSAQKVMGCAYKPIAPTEIAMSAADDVPSLAAAANPTAAIAMLQIVCQWRSLLRSELYAQTITAAVANTKGMVEIQPTCSFD